MVTGWNGWLRDIIPVDRAGEIFGRRLKIATVAAIITGLGAAIFVDWWKGFAAPGEEAFGYSIAFVFGALILGLGSVGFMARIPEPRMRTLGTNSVGGMLRTLTGPIMDLEFRKFIVFQFVWFFVIHLAVPFFAGVHAQAFGVSALAGRRFGSAESGEQHHLLPGLGELG